MLLGAVIINEKEDEIVIQILIGHSDLSIERTVRRMTILTLAANREAILALKNDNGDFIRNILDLYNDVNRLNPYVVRQL